MQKFLITTVAVATLSGAMPAQAATIIGKLNGLASPASILTFDEVVLADNALVTNQYAGFGVTFTPAMRYSPQTGFPNIQGKTLGNFSPQVLGPITLNFTTAQTGVAFAMVSNNTSYLFEALLGGNVADSFSATVGTSAFNYYGFKNANFDAIRVTSRSNDSFLIDNLQLGTTTTPVPEPATWAMMIVGFGFIGGALRQARKANVKFRFA